MPSRTRGAAPKDAAASASASGNASTNAPAASKARKSPAAAQAPAAGGFAERLLAWQARHGRRGLPWQGQRDPYRVWLSEIMLQQTQVTTVLGYYARFLARFPRVVDLAGAPLDEVLTLWSGLGYYSRARNLHRCAQTVVAEHGGRFPTTAAALQTLPGIGASTAAAIAAFCFDERVAILDGNVKRVLARWLAFEGDLAEAGAQRTLWQEASALLPARAADMPAYTQGLMDLGATLCTARQPQCEACPVRADCRARALGRQTAWPIKSRRLKRTRREHWWLWLQVGERLWLQQREATGVWAGLWTLPLLDSADQAAAWAETPGAQVETLPDIVHALTHFDWHLHPLRLRLPRQPAAARLQAMQPGRWVTRAELPDLALPAPLRRLLTAD